MIKSTELRLGNWIIEPSGFNDKKYIIVDEDFLEVLFAARGYSDYEPIPLTLEILEKCGFVGDDSKNKYKFMYLDLKNYGDYESWIVTKNEYDINPGMPLLKYLHQLQNLYFSLTGNELQITL